MLLAGRLPAQEPGARLQIYLLTMGAGDAIYERFGHNAIWVRDSAANTNLIYNFGTFEAPGDLAGIIKFGAKFMMGPPQYWLGVSNLEGTLFTYRMARRDLQAQELNLAPAQRLDIASRLATNALDANKYYAYDYFRDNCSTRVRDLLDLVLGGELKRATIGVPAEGTLRFHTRRSITNDKLLFVGIDASFGPRVDRPLDRWDEMFLPAKVQERVRELTVPGPDGSTVPLVKGEFPILTIGAFHVEKTEPHWAGPFFLVSIGIAGLIRLADSRRRTAIVGRAIGAAWLLLTGFAGVILLFFWIFTQHVFTYANHNLLMLSPLALVLIPHPTVRGRAKHRAWAQPVATALIVSVLIGVVLALVPKMGGQQSGLIAALTALPTLAAANEARRGWNRREGAHDAALEAAEEG